MHTIPKMQTETISPPTKHAITITEAETGATSDSISPVSNDYREICKATYDLYLPLKLKLSFLSKTIYTSFSFDILNPLYTEKESNC